MNTTAAATKTCPGYGAEGAHDLPATTEFFHRNAPSKDGLFSQCKPHANAYQADWNARQRAIAKAEAMPDGKGEAPGMAAQLRAERQLAIERAHAMPPAPRKANAFRQGIEAARERVGLPPAAPGLAAVKPPSHGLAANTPRDQYVQRLGSQPGWTVEHVAGAGYPMPTEPATVATSEGQAALEELNQARAAARRRADADRKRTERAAKKAKATATA